jgi:hypothetical protein
VTEIKRYAIQVTPDQIIGAPRRRRNRQPKQEGGLWSAPPSLTPIWFEGQADPKQLGFGHMDRVALEMQA